MCLGKNVWDQIRIAAFSTSNSSSAEFELKEGNKGLNAINVKVI